jgi:hypothetical protein
MSRSSGPTHSDYVMCRTIGHAWEEIPAERPAPYGDPWWLRCVRCTTVRMDFVTRSTGELLGRQYGYPDDYRHAFDDLFPDAAPTRQDYRQMLFAEHLAKVRRLRAIKAAG